MSTGKIVGGIILGLVVIVGGVLFVGLSNLNALIKTNIETVGSELTGTTVTLAEVDVVITEGHGALHRLVVANPAGYNSPYAFSMNSISLDIDPRSITEPVIVIKNITIDGASIIAEQKSLSENNLQTILDQLKSNGGSNSASPEEGEGNPDVRFMVEQFNFTNAKAQIISPQYGEKELSMPAIKLRDIGDKAAGLTSEQLTQALIKPIIASAKAQVSGIIKAKAQAKLTEKLNEKLSDKDKAKIDKLKSLFNR